MRLAQQTATLRQKAPPKTGCCPELDSKRPPPFPLWHVTCERFPKSVTLSSPLSFAEWLALAGCLLLALNLSSGYVQRLPISSSTLYLVLGLVLGPRALGWVELRVTGGSPWFERLTEVAVVVALFISGLKLRLPPAHAAWSSVYRLAGPVMVLCIGGIAAFAHWGLGLSPPQSLLLAALLAPTDPVLAGSVSVSHAADRDRVKYALSGEAGLNDGTAFPFVVLALEWQRGAVVSCGSVLRWVIVDVIWAVGAALAVGYTLGRVLGKWSIHQRSQQRDTEAPSDLAALALIALAYTAGHLLHAWAFLAVFAAGVGLRQAELRTVAATPHPAIAERIGVSHPPAEQLVGASVSAEELEAPAVAAGVLVAETMSFGTTVERVLEIMLVTLIGAAVGSYWDFRALPIALLLFFVLRPLTVHLLLLGTKTTALQRWLIGWFGIRGIGSLYYVAYAHTASSKLGQPDVALTGLTLSVISLSILLHGSSATPLLALYRKSVTPR